MPQSGPDPSFPYLEENCRFDFPKPVEGNDDSVIAAGGNLSPGMLLSAYEQGLFPWYSEGDPILWQSPDPRFVIFPENLHVSRSMQKLLRQNRFRITIDEDFESVIRNCAEIDRPGQDGTWINSDIIDAYTEMHRLGWAHSAEAWLPNGELAGGCYGIRINTVFFGESMFSRVSNASKAAFLTFARHLVNNGVELIDCQVYTPYLESLGAAMISRSVFLDVLAKTLGTRQTTVTARR
jgi:leucyl/phenylalanyl-tRNA--protein transferase